MTKRSICHPTSACVIHRDLKPSNILVTSDGGVRRLDFGIAKLLNHDTGGQTVLTEFGGAPPTAACAAPEQLAGQPLGVASDVYSLGVVLYEMLTGTRPYEARRDALATLQEILGSTVSAPSAAAKNPSAGRELRGDVDTIVLKALKKRPDERYQTVSALADDIERLLDGRPVLARPDTRVYRLKKFVARNRLATVAATASLVAVVAGAGISAWQAREATYDARADRPSRHYSCRGSRPSIRPRACSSAKT